MSKVVITCSAELVHLGDQFALISLLESLSATNKEKKEKVTQRSWCRRTCMQLERCMLLTIPVLNSKTTSFWSAVICGSAG